MTGRLLHEALLYRTPAEFVAGILPFVRAGLAAGEPVLVAVPGANLSALRASLNGSAAAIEQVDMVDAGRNPGRIIPGVMFAFAQRHAGTRVRMVGQPIWPGRDVLEYPACVQHEALINLAFAGQDIAILCPYDVSRLGLSMVHDVACTHPTVASGRARTVSPSYRDPLTVVERHNTPLPDPPPEAVALPVRAASLGGLRRFVAAQAAAADLDENRRDDLVIAVNELVSNTLSHAGGDGSLAVWVDPDCLVCQVSDSGHIGDPLAGRLPPKSAYLEGGRGLLLVNHLCDLVRVYTRPGHTSVRVYMRRGRFSALR